MLKRAALPLLCSLLAACGQTPLTVAQGSTERLQAQATGHWVSGTYYSAYGARFYKLWVPAGYDGSSARPMLVMLHGCQQNADDFAAGTGMNALADARNFLVLYPEQGLAYNGADCWNWFYIANQVRGSGEPSVIAGMIGWAKSHYRVSSKVAVAGISAGAGMANIMGCTYPDLFQGVASVAGMMYGAATSMTGGTNAMLYGSIYSPDSLGTSCKDRMGTLKHAMPTLVFQGMSDSVVNPLNATQVVGQWAQTNDLVTDGLDNGNVDNVADAVVTGSACRAYTRRDYLDSSTGSVLVRKYEISGMGHAWPGGSAAGSYTDSCAPNASGIMADFFGF